MISGAIPNASKSREIRALLNPVVIGKQVLSFDALDSTNETAKKMAEDGAGEGLVILAQMQRKGRGRQGRQWISPPDQGVYLSVVLRPALPVSDAGWLAIYGGVATAEALENVGVQNVTIKWPNDVLVRGRKIAGVLVEPRVGQGMIEFAVLGLGINVRQTQDSWSAALKDTATSCHMEGVDVSCEPVVQAVLTKLDSWYETLKAGRFDDLMKAWIQRGGIRNIPEIES